MKSSRLGWLVALPLSALTASWFAVRSWLLHWGATPDEIARPLPGDELVPRVSTEATMAITIDAPPQAVWPWLVQMGIDRAGFYSSLFVENTVLRLGVTNADRIVPEWQDLKVGDHLWFTPADYPTPRMGPVVVEMQPNRALILTLGELGQPAPGTWQFVLVPAQGDATRLLFRQRSSADQPLGSQLPNLLMEPGYFVMERAMLRGLKRRVERVADHTRHAASVAGTSPAG